MRPIQQQTTRNIVVMLSILLSTPCLAQQAPPPLGLDPMVVTATRTATPLSQTTRSVSVITADTIAAQGAQTVSEVLRQIPGVDIVRTGAAGGLTSVFTRGGENNFTLILLDGVEVNQSGGQFDLADLTVDNIDHIEVIRGPASTLYGSGAVSGVIHIITKRGTGRPTGSVSFAGGSFATRIWQGSATGGTAWGGLAVSASRTDTDGHLDFNNQYANDALALRGDLYPDDQTDITLTLRHNDSEFHFPTNGAGRVLFHNQFRTSRETTLGVQGERLILPWWRSKLLFSYHDVKSRTHSEFFTTPPDTTLSLFILHEVRTSLDWQSDFTLNPVGLLTVGLRYKEDEERENSVQRVTTSGYLQQQCTLLDPLVLIAGFRVDGSDTFGTHVTYQVSAAYPFPTKTTLRAAVGTGLKEPTFFENFAHSPFAKGNPNLEPERSFSWEVGVEQSLWKDRLRLSATFFRNRYSDLIDFTAAPTPEAPNFFNIEAAKAIGVEVGATLRFVPAWSLGADYTYLHTEVTDAGSNTDASAAFVKGQDLLRRPRHKFHGFVAYSGSRFQARLDLHYVGSRTDRDFSTFPAIPVHNPDYAKLDLALRYTIVKEWGWVRSLEVFARGENLLDEPYAEAFGFTAPGIAGFAGIKLSL